MFFDGIPYFEGMVNQNYPPELQWSNTNTTGTEALPPFITYRRNSFIIATTDCSKLSILHCILRELIFICMHEISFQRYSNISILNQLTFDPYLISLFCFSCTIYRSPTKVVFINDIFCTRVFLIDNDVTAVDAYLIIRFHCFL